MTRAIARTSRAAANDPTMKSFTDGSAPRLPDRIAMNAARSTTISSPKRSSSSETERTTTARQGHQAKQEGEEPIVF